MELLLTTQCVAQKNVCGRPGQGPDASTMANICMKLNAKLGGINNLIDRTTRYVDFLGRCEISLRFIFFQSNFNILLIG